MTNFWGKEICHINGGEIFLIKWPGNENVTINFVLQVREKYFLLVDIHKETYWSRYNTLTEELQTKSEILDYLEYLQTSGEAEVVFLGQLFDMDTYEKVVSNCLNETNLLQLKRRKRFIARRINLLANTILKKFQLQEDIRSLDYMSGDLLYVFNRKRKMISKERLTVVGDRLLLLPVDRTCTTPIIEEAMTIEEFYQYLYELIVSEKCHIVWESVFRKELPDVTFSLDSSVAVVAK